LLFSMKFAFQANEIASL